MDPGDRPITLEEFKSWKAANLREYLTRRGLGTTGDKEELAALCYSATVLKLPVLPSQQEIIEGNRRCYQKILELEDYTIPDPFDIHDGWEGEKSGICKWPPTFLTDITMFLMKNGDVASVDNLLKDYKVGKTYEYFTCNWLKEVFYRDIKSSPYCFLRSKCQPSQRLKDDLHDLWVCVHKVDGAVMAAFCSCTAGLGQTCNHIAALLFRVEAANRFGISSCTSAECMWNVPSDVQKLQPSKLSSLAIKKSNRKKIGLPREPQNESTRDTTCSRDDTSTPASTAEDISVFSLPFIVQQFQSQTSCYDFLSFLPKYSSRDILRIERSTVGQHDSENWHMLCKGRITASCFYQVFTKVNTVIKNPNCEIDCSSLLGKVMGYTKVNPNVKSLKYGRETEPIAITSYLTDYQKHHRNVISSSCGMFIDGDNIFLGATPDLLVSCSCCGDGLLEVKCPVI